MTSVVTAELGGWVIEADRDVNRDHYRVVVPWECVCDHCVNWRSLGESALPPGVVEFLGDIGVDVLKPHEVFEYGPGAPGGHLMGGWYHFSGRIVRQPPRPMEWRNVRQGIPYRLDDGFRFDFYDHLGGPGASTEPPEPHATFEFGWTVPWVGTDTPGCLGEGPLET
jgi:hypothetical protein